MLILTHTLEAGGDTPKTAYQIWGGACQCNVNIDNPIVIDIDYTRSSSVLALTGLRKNISCKSG